ncbi:MAG: ribokinase [Naasia sp.]|nr:ribokinase [Naasia sp.]
MTPVAVAVVGSINLDLVVRSSRAPRPGETILGHSYAEHPGGKGANQAVAAARVAPTYLVGTLGDDTAATTIRGHLDHLSVDMTYLSVADAPTGRAVIAVTSDGENSITVIPGANRQLDAGTVLVALDAIRPAVVLAQLEVPLAALEAAHRWARSAGARWVFNPSPVEAVPPALIADADPLIVNEQEAAAILAAMGSGDPAGGGAALGRLLSQECRSVVVTAGGDGAYICEPAASPTHVPGIAVPVADTTGAGDELAGRIAGELALGTSLADAARRAVGAAARIVATPREWRETTAPAG